MNPLDPLYQQLSLEEFSTLEKFFNSGRLSEDAISSIEMLDGYLAAIIVGTELVLPSVWMPFIWGTENHPEPVFDTQEQAEEVTGLFIRHMNTIARQFHEDPEGFQPLFENIVYEDDEEFRFAVEEWALGFLLGIELSHESWKPVFDDEDASLLLFPLFMLARVGEGTEALPEKEFDELALHVAEYLIEIYFFWKLQQ